MTSLPANRADGSDGRISSPRPRPVIMTAIEVRGRLRVGHTRSLSDPAAPILVDERATAWPGAAAADLRCPSCAAAVTIARGAAETLAVIEHQRGCPELAALQDRAEAAR